jgi:hypothetical protein
VRTGLRYVVVDAIESNGNPLRELIRFRFQLGADPYHNPYQYKPPRWGGLDEPLKGSTEAVYYFYFSSDSSLDENVEDFRTFIAEHLDDELVPEEPMVNAGEYHEGQIRQAPHPTVSKTIQRVEKLLRALLCSLFGG